MRGPNRYTDTTMHYMAMFRRDLDRAQEIYQSQVDLAKEYTEELATEIQSGEKSTGDRLIDGLICYYKGRLIEDQGIAIRYIELDERLKPGEPIVAIYRRVRSYPDMDQTSQDLELDIKFGLVKEPGISFDAEKGIYIPVRVPISPFRSDVAAAEIDDALPLADKHKWLRDPIDYGDYSDPIDTNQHRGFSSLYYDGQKLSRVQILAGRGEIKEFLARDLSEIREKGHIREVLAIKRELGLSGIDATSLDTVN